MRITPLALVAGFLLPYAARGQTEPKPAAPEYISAMPGRIARASMGWGEMGINAAAHAPGQIGLPIKIAEKIYARGLGHHASGEILVELDGLYATFEAEVGVQTQPGNTGSVCFRVLVDGKPAFDSGVMKNGEPAKAVSVPVDGAQELTLVAADAGDGIACDAADWAEARLVPDPAAKGRPLDATSVSLAPFARVCTWDPARMDGSRANRVKEFRAEDLFTDTDVPRDKDGGLTVPTGATPEGPRGCIGLQWAERRRLRQIGLRFKDVASMPSPEGVKVEAWAGESPWQGGWKPMPGALTARDDTWTYEADSLAVPKLRGGSWKIRWILPDKSADGKPVRLRGLTAYGRSRWEPAVIRLQMDPPQPGAKAGIAIYNGHLDTVDGKPPTPAGEAAPPVVMWGLDKPLEMKLTTCRPGSFRMDRTVLRVRLPGGQFGVAVDDVLASGGVFVPSAGFLVTPADSTLTVDECRKRIAAKETVLQRVRKMPEQTFAQSLEKTRNPIQDNGPVMLSLACDNGKFTLHREGMVQYGAGIAWPADPGRERLRLRVTPSFGGGRPAKTARRMAGGWVPVMETTVELDGRGYAQRSFVAPADRETAPPAAAPWLNKKPLFVSALDAQPAAAAGPVSLKLDFLADEKRKQPVELQTVPGGIVAKSGDRLLALIEMPEGSPLKAEVQGGAVVLSGQMPAAGGRIAVLSIPAWAAKAEDAASLKGAADLEKEVEAYWRRVMADAAQIEIPDPVLLNVIRASQVHCLMAARNRNDAAQVEAWTSADRYGPLESEAHAVIRGMDFLGHHEFARRSLDFFVKKYNAAGFLTTGYTLMGTGWHLWTLGEHHALAQDDDWMKSVAPEVARVGRWVLRQRAKTMKDGRPESGFMPPGVMADWNAFAFYYALNAYYQAGLAWAGRALEAVGDPAGAGFAREADAYREEILKAWRWTRARMPAVPLSNGAWVPAYPSQVHGFAPTGDLFPAEDENRSWCYDVEIGAPQLVPAGVLPADAPEVGDMMEHLEDVQFLSDGWFDYPGEANRADWFNRGGFSKVQPYYTRTTEIYGLRDEVRPFLRSYFNALASLLSLENLSLWECFHNSGGWNKTHETGYFLHQTRTLLVTERGDELWLGAFVPQSWMADGQAVTVRHAPTQFGPVSYEIRSEAAKGALTATVEPPTRNPPAALVVRLRHPEGKLMKSVTVDGAKHKDFDAEKEIVRIKPAPAKPVAIRAEY